MYIINITNVVPNQLQEKWISWIKKNYLKKYSNIKKISLIKVVEYLSSTDINYSLQYCFANKLEYDAFIKIGLPDFEKQTELHFGFNVTTFKSELKLICEV
tara:strand:- start:195 stop:497 length:303 start_codon:yes stop_codon:yes gene_type:complete